MSWRALRNKKFVIPERMIWWSLHIWPIPGSILFGSQSSTNMVGIDTIWRSCLILTSSEIRYHHQSSTPWWRSWFYLLPVMEELIDLLLVVMANAQLRADSNSVNDTLSLQSKQRRQATDATWTQTVGAEWMDNLLATTCAVWRGECKAS